MSSLSREAIQMVCDGVLIRNALVLRHSLEVIKGVASSIPDGSRHIEEIEHSLQLMEEEIKRRGLKMPEGEGQSGFLKGIEYTSESQKEDGNQRRSLVPS